MARLLALMAVLLGGLVSSIAVHAAEAPASAPVQALLAQLPTADYATKRNIVEELATHHEPAVRTLLVAFLEGHLYVRDSDQAIVVSETAQDGLTDVGTNNQLRRSLKGAIAKFDLSDADPKVRRQAIDELARTMDVETATELRAVLAKEPDASVRKALESAIAMGELSAEDAEIRLSAVRSLKGNLSADAFNRLTTMVEPGTDGKPSEPDVRIRMAANETLTSIRHWRDFYSLVETLFFGLSLGSVLTLAAIGLAITFGVMGVINMAHGELMMLGAYSVFVVQQLMPNHIGASLLVSIPVAFVVSGLVGVLIERGIVRHLYGRPLETLLATFGVSLILQQLVRDVFSPNNRPVETPPWMAGSLRINDILSITYTRLYIIIFALLILGLLLLIMRRTRLGLEVRAVSQNRNMAKAMGVRTDRVDALTFGLGSGIAGVAGVALSQLTNVGPNLGQNYIVDSFMVVVFGGVGSLWGTQIGGTTLGVVNKVLEPMAGAVLAKILVLVGLILFIQRRPRGLFPQKGRAAEA